jgi:SET domain-containing protein
LSKLNLKNSHPYLSVKSAGVKGRGVFASKAIKKDTVFLVDPIIKVTLRDVPNYIFEHQKKQFLDLGIGSLINHSLVNANCYWIVDYKNMQMKYIALTDISKGTEILHDYNWDTVPKDFVE